MQSYFLPILPNLYRHGEITFKAFDSIMRLPTLATCWIPPSCSEHNCQLSLRLNTFPAQCSETMERMVWTAWRSASKCTNIAALLLQQQALKIIMHTNLCLIKHAKHVDYKHFVQALAVSDLFQFTQIFVSSSKNRNQHQSWSATRSWSAFLT